MSDSCEDLDYICTDHSVYLIAYRKANTEKIETTVLRHNH